MLRIIRKITPESKRLPSIVAFVAIIISGYPLYQFGAFLDILKQPPSWAFLMTLIGILLEVVAAAMIYAWRQHRRDVRRERDSELLAQLAFYDSLTNLPNRLLFCDRLTYQLATMKRSRVNIALLLIDLDGFKRINDTLGHLAGDEILVQVANRIRKTCRETDTVSRFGGDEFAILQPIEERGQAALLANRIINSLSKPFLLSHERVLIGCSIGITITEDPDVLFEELFGQADHSLYQSKKLGGGTLSFFDCDPTALMPQTGL